MQHEEQEAITLHSLPIRTSTEGRPSPFLSEHLQLTQPLFTSTTLTDTQRGQIITSGGFIHFDPDFKKSDFIYCLSATEIQVRSSEVNIFASYKSSTAKSHYY
jgi:hypothetical protein